MTIIFDPVEFTARTVRPMAEHTFPFICSIVGVESRDAGRHIGSALRVAAHGRKLLVTAKHVFDAASSEGMHAAFVRERGGVPESLSNFARFEDSQSDLVALVVDDPRDSNEAYLDSDLFDTDLEARRDDYLFVHGFPGERAAFVFGQSHHRSLPYGVMERDDDLPTDKQSFEFAMDYDPLNMLQVGGVEASFVMPAGLSGSGVWRIGAYRQKPEAWTPGSSRLVGLVTRWNSEKMVLLATNAARLGALVDQAQ